MVSECWRSRIPLRAAGQGPLAVKPPHFAARAKRVIFLFMNGGMSQVDTFDPKPVLDKHHGEPMPGPKIRPTAPRATSCDRHSVQQMRPERTR